MRKIDAKNAPVAAHIERLSHDGRGVAHINGKTVFVSGGLPGEEALVKIKKKRASYNEGEAISVRNLSNLREAPKCQHFGLCGGCNLQHMNGSAQIHHKQDTVLELLAHQANILPGEIMPPLLGEKWGYRTKARLGVKYVAGKNKVLVGFREKNTRHLANLLQCEILHPDVGKKLTIISDMLYQLGCRSHIPQIEVVVANQETALIIRHMVELSESDKDILKQFAQQENYKLYLQPKGPDTIHLFCPENADPLMEYHLIKDNLRLKFHPSQFTQINHEINGKLIEKAINLLDLKHDDTVLDLFCGIGNFTLPLAKHCHHIIGVEGSDASVSSAKANARLNAITNANFYVDNLFEPPFHSSWRQQKYNKLLLDPPRSGAKETISQLSTWKPSRIVYISCNPSTLARDAKLLIDQGYTLANIGVADMFPHTQHVETIALFLKGKTKHAD